MRKERKREKMGGDKMKKKVYVGRDVCMSAEHVTCSIFPFCWVNFGWWSFCSLRFYVGGVVCGEVSKLRLKLRSRTVICDMDGSRAVVCV